MGIHFELIKVAWAWVSWFVGFMDNVGLHKFDPSYGLNFY